MPIKIPDHLPAVNVLQKENIFVMTSERARTQDIRPLQILLVNLMQHRAADRAGAGGAGQPYLREHAAGASAGFLQIF